ncbi:uncharacterized protein BDZ99DRAFT_479138 [Mytilinidion resinicola]|uniref:Aminoglycoside phosphotransferase domain-containing protein n=1 Tax=Mytilinidion resinicola TaxID=574789 RepID=A0A6A6YDV5_9PEZI|nr:uncharacterized protein BDZ99DRAFT_479138 [Mytilinidion resinicola]KAF2806738.1 hypothetical protein BDZ99DRAFT_479138 [Mytilinidion resinicola]
MSRGHYLSIKYTNKIALLDRRPHKSNIMLRYQVTDEATISVEKKGVDYNNALGKPYSLQDRLPGRCLIDAWDEFNHTQKLSLVRAMGIALLEMQSVTNPCAGIVGPKYTSTKRSFFGLRKANPEILQFEVPRRETRTGEPTTPPAKPQSTLELRLTQFQRFCDWENAHWGEADPLWDNLKEIAQKMGDMGLFEDQGFYFCHMDLHARNILVQVIDDTTVEISGILDWDSGVFGPKFLSCAPLMWLWLPEDVDHEDETLAEDDPEDPETLELKEAFEEIVGRDFLRYAYKPEYIIARRVMVAAMSGMFQSADLDAVEKIVQDWEELHPSGGYLIVSVVSSLTPVYFP